MSIRKQLGGLAAVGALVLGSLVATTAPANAQPVTLPITGTATVAKQNATLQIPEGASLDGDFNFGPPITVVGDVNIPPIEAHIRLLGIPGLGDTTSTVKLVQTSPTAATVGEDGVVSVDLSFRLAVPRVSSDLLPFLNIVRSGCGTGEITTTLRSTTPFSLTEPVQLEGEYTIPKFQGCGYKIGPTSGRDLLLTSLLSGSGNKMTLQAGPIQF
ncbi:hypothetical protein KV102_11085 [Mumia sp. zg.B53]|uniref:hypothetical protein n=1 Tax=unclassified Mumia TaxID=2621872 RepID=UPI001C6F3937|nr:MULTISPECIES: hypothetical protein [unclassified Mumia]MBW9206894.1 hypothetical protein [Mumia sp. zg.B17]MBW9210819.1 hypothetical protein [Mumia sp. zg.B21]MBW9215384.1 hypothetical protein [Mumia sp. zg.B53]MDD9350131.1 hypothetical protein [Mumia sp.]